MQLPDTTRRVFGAPPLADRTNVSTACLRSLGLPATAGSERRAVAARNSGLRGVGGASSLDCLRSRILERGYVVTLP